MRPRHRFVAAAALSVGFFNGQIARTQVSEPPVSSSATAPSASSGSAVDTPTPTPSLPSVSPEPSAPQTVTPPAVTPSAPATQPGTVQRDERLNRIAAPTTERVQTADFPPTSQPDSIPKTVASTEVTAATPTGEFGKVVVTSDLDRSRDQIAPSLGAVTYTIGPDQIDTTPQGQDAPFQQVLLRAPGVAQDSFGQVHVRGEHANLEYRINGVLLPEPVAEFGQELDTHLIQSVTLIDGTLPAQFGFRTAGIIDVTSKSGEALKGGELSLYGGSYDTFTQSFELGGSEGKLDYFFTGTHRHDNFGIENTTTNRTPLHDATDQQRAFSYLSYHLDDTSRVSLLLNASDADFQLPDTQGLAPAFTLNGAGPEQSQSIDENQNEQEYYAVAAYQKVAGDLSFQISGFSRYGLIDFKPDRTGDLIFQGVAGAVYNDFVTNGVQFDSSYILNRDHTLRGGFVADYTTEKLLTNTLVFPVDNTGAQASGAPIDLQDNDSNDAWEAGVYLQDEWRIDQQLTLNYGARYDRFDANFDDEGQLSPRVNAVYKIDDKTTTHAGYSRFFVPPPVQSVNAGSVARANGTTNAAAIATADAPKVERSNYYDVGISRKIYDPLTVGLDGFYKDARNLVDLGQFGQAVIESPYNYHRGHVYGAELSSTYKEGGFTAYGNLGWVAAYGKRVNSQQFEFDPDEFAYISSHYVHLDHESAVTASTGVSYAWRNDLVYADLLYGSGLRSGFANENKVHPNYPVNVGYQHIFHPFRTDKQSVTLRFDITNIFDQTYQLRDGTGIGVAAAQDGQRRALFAGLSYDF